ncbi:MAG TPA: histidine phosphatase family protein [Burkholderiaceae bacterium]
MTSAWVRRWQAVAVVAVLLWPAYASPQREDKSNSPPNVIDGAALVEALRGGGYVVYFRHGKTDLSTSDSDRTSLANCATQRILSQEGRQQMTDIGKQIQRLRIPVGIVLSSPYCRCIDTAKLAFGKVVANRDLAHTVTADEGVTRQRAGELSKLLGTVPTAGTNTVLSGHTGNLEEATGIWPSPEGVAIVFKPDGRGANSYVATVGPTRWAELAQAHPPAKTKR